jgi:hypothetical protein
MGIEWPKCDRERNPEAVRRKAVKARVATIRSASAEALKMPCLVRNSRL